MKSANPYLNFAGNTEEALGFYRSVFGGDFPMVLRFREFGPDMDGPDGDKIAHMSLPIGRANMLMATDALESHGQKLVVGNNVAIQLEAESADEARRVFDELAAGGEAKMPLGRTEWAELYGMCVDRYGVQWMVNYPGSVSFSAP